MKQYSIILAFILISCTSDLNHQAIDTTISSPNLIGKTILSFLELRNLHNNEIGKDTLVVGYIVSKATGGNFFKEFYIQNTLETKDITAQNPRMGIRVRVGLRSVGDLYGFGRKIALNLEGLKKTNSGDLMTIGAVNVFFIKDISEFDVDTHILRFDEVANVTPKSVRIKNLTTNDLNTLVKIENVRFKEELIGKPLANLPEDDFDGLRTLLFCNTTRIDTIVLETSNFSDFSNRIIANDILNTTAIYTHNFDGLPVLILNDTEGLKVVGPYVDCPEIVSSNLMITEVADPKVGVGEVARYVEIYNPTNHVVDLEGWTLVRCNKTNTNSYKLPIKLDGLFIVPKGFVVIANNDIDEQSGLTWFETYFGFPPSLTNSNLDGNGDDAYQLVDNLNKVKDLFGQVNVDGTGLGWEYENGVAVRNLNSVLPNANFDINSWTIKTELNQLVIKDVNTDFNPGLR